MVLECVVLIWAPLFCIGKEVQLWESGSILHGMLCGEHVEHISIAFFMRLWLKLEDNQGTMDDQAVNANPTDQPT